MARKKKHEEHVNHERWLVSYADFITLLFATFTALFAMSNADNEKMAKAALSIKQAFASTGSIFSLPAINKNSAGNASSLVIQINPATPTVVPPRSTPAQAPQTGKEKKEEGKEEGKGEGKGEGKEEAREPKDPGDLDSLFNGLSLNKNNEDAEQNPLGSTPTPTPTPQPSPTPQATPAPLPGQAEGGGSEKLAAEIKALMQNFGLDKVVEVREEKRGTVISLGEAAFFAPGEIEVLPACVHQLDRIINALRKKAFEIRVEGHTDNTPVTSGRYRDNLELSTLRASRIVNFMIKEYKFDPRLLSASGYGEARPIADNATKDGQQKNRRVDIVILNERSISQEPR